MQRLFWTALVIGVVAADAGSARPPGEASQPERLARFNPARVVDRIMSFDRDADGRITKDELPERMQGLVARFDRNGDGVLSADEVRTSVNARITVPGRVITSGAGADEGLPGVISPRSATSTTPPTWTSTPGCVSCSTMRSTRTSRRQPAGSPSGEGSSVALSAGSFVVVRRQTFDQKREVCRHR
ncbi:MAG: hypothetical protein DMF98_28390 [Acidobacteria bacterium]|nr:MAG: hypothetical protein DMF98_28390 [Acidobacteriota bacterium]